MITWFIYVATFEDKRKANFDKGQAVLDRRRQQLKDTELQEIQIRKEAQTRDEEKKIKIKFLLFSYTIL